MGSRNTGAEDAGAPLPQRKRRKPRGVPIHDTSVVNVGQLGRVATADGLFVTDERQRIVTWSSAAQRMLGYSPEEVVGQPCYLVLMGREPDGHPVCGPFCSVTRNARRGRATAAYEVTARDRDGRVKCFSNSVLVLEEENPTHFNVIHLLRETATALAGRRAASDAPEDPAAEPPIEALTRRQLEVLRLFADGLSIEEIAEALTISIYTARNHIASIQHKLGARNRLEVVLLGMRYGLV
jgi:PAS domain S-box-containing protein